MDRGIDDMTVGPVGRWFGSCFYACGRDGLPARIEYAGRLYDLAKVLKHDFIAGTGLYEARGSDADRPGRIVCKINRRKHFCLVPLGWLGRLITHNELCNLRRCEGIEGVPKVLGRVGATAYLYEYIEGACLDPRRGLPGDFFDRLLGVLRQIHARGLVHFDLHKRGNILVGDEGRPYIIDFQLSTHIGERLLISRRLSARLRRRLQAYDLYHLYKHKRRCCPTGLTEAELRLSCHPTVLVRVHRAVAGPLKRIRRACLRAMHARGIITGTQGAALHAETDPVRWSKK
jgi:hypothetical protein